MTEPLPFGTPGRGIAAFLDSKAFIRVLLGGRGSGKTFGLAQDATEHIWHNAGAKVIIARQTEASQADSSIDTFMAYFESLGTGWEPASTGLFQVWNNGRKIAHCTHIASRL